MGFFDQIKDAITGKHDEPENDGSVEETAPMTAVPEDEVPPTSTAPVTEPAAPEVPVTPGAPEPTAAEPAAADEPATASEPATGAEPAADAEPAAAPEPAATPEPATAAEPTAAEAAGRTFTVERGDTLESIAQRLGVEPRDIAELNEIENPDLIYPGQTFKVPE